MWKGRSCCVAASHTDKQGEETPQQITTRSPSSPSVTFVDLTQEPNETPTTFSQSPVCGQNLTRPEVLGRLGLNYVSSVWARRSDHSAYQSWQGKLNFLGPPKDWSLDIRQAFAGNVDASNPLFLSTFAFINGVPCVILCDYLMSRPQGVDSATIDKTELFYNMWKSPTRGKFYRSEQFAYCLKCKRYLDLNFN